MTMHTRVAVTAGEVTPEDVFVHCRILIGADDRYHVSERDPLSMAMGQGLPALMWVTSSDGKPEPCDSYCDPDCDRTYHDPAHTVMAHFDTAYGYTGGFMCGRRAECGDLHAHLVHSLGRWLESKGCTWRWYDESGDGWGVDHLDLGALGNHRLGAIGLPEVAA